MRPCVPVAIEKDESKCWALMLRFMAASVKIHQAEFHNLSYVNTTAKRIVYYFCHYLK